MKVLIADDGVMFLRLLTGIVSVLGHEVVPVSNGVDALHVLTTDPEIDIAMLDWVMPKLDGLEVLRTLRHKQLPRQPYVILVTSKSGMPDIVAGLDMGADDYVTKPFERVELEARIRVGMRMVEARNKVIEKCDQLADALDQVKRLQGMLPICMHCKSIRDDRQSWRKLEEYISEHSDARFSHGICDNCMRRHHA